MQLRTIRKISATLPMLAAACGAPPAASAGLDGGDSTFVAVQGDFSDFESWVAFDGGTAPADNIPVQSQRMIYVNELPPPDAASFPVGTILVKTIAGAQTFAMVKRGGGFNTDGAVGWEWLELVTAPDGQPLISWRGAAPPANTYSSTPAMTCNACHMLCRSNDYVCGAGPQLSAH
jgi:hypothetical protein